MHRKKIILITGGTSGLGKVIAQLLAFNGHVVYCTSRNPASKKNDNQNLIQLDITSDSGCDHVINEIMAREKQIDIIINNAGITLSGPSLEFSVNDFKNILDTNLLGSFRLIKSACSFSNKPKLIINITSLNGFLSFPNFGLYSASKFAMEAFGLSLRYELSPHTKVVNVAPGALVSESKSNMSHRPVREKSRFINWLMPLTSHEKVANVIDGLINASSVPPRVLIGRDAHIINFMQKWLPLFVFDKIIFYLWNKK